MGVGGGEDGCGDGEEGGRGEERKDEAECWRRSGDREVEKAR